MGNDPPRGSGQFESAVIYWDPVYATTSLKSDPASGFAPVGCTVANGYRQWYVLDEQQSMVFLKDDVNKFYRVGEGRNEQLAFFHPVYERTFYAKFLGNERPVPHSPDPQPTNLDIAMTQLQINTEGQPYGEEVQLYLDLTKDWTEALCFHSAGQRIRTGWRKWQAIQHSDGRVYYCYESDVTGETYFTWGLPVLLVDTWWKCGSEKPIRFRVEGTEFKTVKRKWLAGKNGSFYVYVQSGKFYMCYQLPEEACG
ncbi:hypothetical protein PLIIFM63780_010583 [Purpureocillium lilacinum]|nr:hypothetical protein PLIIFM63780_010583 [Purpureocillium lilacinum]